MSMGRDVTRLTLVGSTEDLGDLASVLDDVLASTRVARHSMLKETSAGTGALGVRDADFAPRG